MKSEFSKDFPRTRVDKGLRDRLSFEGYLYLKEPRGGSPRCEI